MKFESVNVERETWNTWLEKFPQAHLLQTWEWSSLKKISGWSARFFVWRNENEIEQPQAMAMVLVRALPKPWHMTGLKVMYIPKGPILDWSNASLRQKVFDDLTKEAQRSRAIFLKIDPDVRLGKGYPGSDDFWQDTLGEQVFSELQHHRLAVF